MGSNRGLAAVLRFKQHMIAAVLSREKHTEWWECEAAKRLSAWEEYLGSEGHSVAGQKFKIESGMSIA